MAYLSDAELKKLNFKFLGNNVLISDKAAIYNHEKIEIGDNSRIDDFCIVSGKVIIGNFVHVTPMCLLAGGLPGLQIEDFATLAYGVKAFSQSDDYSGLTMCNSLIPKKFKKEVFLETTIGKYSIIGAGAVLLPGASLGEGCSVGAMSLVTKPLLPWGIYAGSPAKKIKDRNKNLLLLKEQFLKEVRNDSI